MANRTSSNTSNLSSSSSLPTSLAKPTLAEWFFPSSNSSKKVQVSMYEEGGITMDDASSKASSISIPPTAFLPSNGKELARMHSISLPPSPSKSEVKASRSLDDLREAIQKMKENSNMVDSVEEAFESSFSHLPLELRQADGLPTQEQSSEFPFPKGMYSAYPCFSSSSHEGT